MTACRLMGLATPAASALLAGSLLAQEMPVPPDDQGAIFKKIISYDRVLKRGEGTKVFIVGAHQGDAVAEDLAKSFRSVGVAPILVWKNETLETRPGEQIVVVAEGGGVHNSKDWSFESSIVYSMPGADLDRVKQFCTQAGVLSISGVPSFAEQGQVSVSVDRGAGGQQIVVNLERLKAEKHELSAELLRLARVIR